MVSAKTVLFSAALLAGSVLAAPAIDGELQKRACGEMVNSPAGSFPMCWGPCASDPACAGGQPSGGNGGQGGQGGQGHEQGGSSQPVATVVVQQPQSSPSAEPKSQGGSSTPASNSDSGSSSSGSGDAQIDMINTYRKLMNKPAMTLGSNLVPNIAKTLADNPGKMVHELNPGSMAQVLAGGNCGDFKSALVYGWICEIPSLLPAGSCNGGNYNSDGQTGHAEILSSTSYTKAACHCADGIWGCDFA